MRLRKVVGSILVKNNVYKNIVAEKFQLIEKDKENSLENITVTDLHDISKRDKDILVTEKIDYLVTGQRANQGFVIIAHNKVGGTITPIVYGNKDQHITYAEDTRLPKCRGDMSYEIRIKHEGNTIKFCIDFLWFISMKLVED